jgi:hypothetical protein
MPTTERRRKGRRGTGGRGRGDMARRRTPDTRPRPGAWAGYAACAWAFLFAAQSLYHAAGGRAGLGTSFSPEITRLAVERVPWFVALLWVVFALKVAAGVLALALVRPWGEVFPRPLLLVLAWGAGVLLAWHGGLFVIGGGLALGGVVPAPEDPVLSTVLRWYAFAWGPWFLLGGALFAAAALSYLRGSPDLRAGVAFSALGALGALGLSVAMLAMGVG